MLLVFHCYPRKDWRTGEVRPFGQHYCVDAAACRALVAERYEKARAARERRAGRPADLHEYQRTLHGPEGGVCKWCGGTIYRRDRQSRIVPARQRMWHDGRVVDERAEPEPRCVQEYNRQPFDFRGACWVKDGGVCQRCGLDAKAALEAWDAECPRWEDYQNDDPEDHWGRGDEYHDARRAWLARKPTWAADHVHPLIDGGENLVANGQVLCDPCHKTKTAEEARERAAKRRGPAPPDPQLGLGVA